MGWSRYCEYLYAKWMHRDPQFKQIPQKTAVLSNRKGVYIHSSSDIIFTSTQKTIIKVSRNLFNPLKKQRKKNLKARV